MKDEAVYSHFVHPFKLELLDLLRHYMALILPVISSFRKLERFCCSWQITVVDWWNLISADTLLLGEKDGWRTVLRDIQRLLVCCNPHACNEVY